MDFTAMDARAYRGLNADQYELRRSLVLSLAAELPEDATDEQVRSIDAEMDVIKAEDSRRDAMTELRNHKAAEVIGGAGRVVASTRAAEDAPADKTLGGHFAAYVKERGHEKSFHIVAPAYRAATDAQKTPSSITGAITTYDRNIVAGPRIPFNVLDLLRPEVIDGNTLVYFVEDVMEGTIANSTAEGAAKSQVHFKDPVAKTVTLEKVAAYVKESDEVIDDAAFLASTINGRLLYELNKVRQAKVITELLGTSGVQTASWKKTATFTDISLDIADAIANAIADVQEESGYAADGIVMTPDLWKQLRIGHFDDGQYVGGGYFEQGATPTVWGLPVAVSSQLTSGHILVGAFGTCASLVTKADGVTVESANTDQDDFTKNLMTIRAEVREKLAVRRPAGFVDLTVATA